LIDSLFHISLAIHAAYFAHSDHVFLNGPPQLNPINSPSDCLQRSALSINERRYATVLQEIATFMVSSPLDKDHFSKQ
jgi:hypothetical protein